MKIDFAKKAIVALLFILIALLVAILILMSKSGPSATPSDTDTTPAVTTDAVDTSSGTTEAVTTAPDADGTTEAVTTDAVSVTDPVTTDPPATDPPVTDPVTTDPPVTDPPSVDPEAPEGFSLTKTYESESGTWLNIRAVCTAVKGENGSVSLTVDVYLIHYSLGMGPRNGCLLTVGENTVKFSTERIKQEENKKTATLLFSHTEEVAYGDIVDVYVKMPIRVTYGSGENAKYIEYLEIDTALLVA